MPLDNTVRDDAIATMSDTAFVQRPTPPSTDWTGQDLRWKIIKLGKAEVRLDYTSATAPSWVEAAVNALNRISQLPENWDSYGANPIQQRTLEHALWVLTKVMSPRVTLPDITPTNRGGVRFEWSGHGKELEVIVEAPFRCVMRTLDDASGAEDEAPFSIDFGPLVAFLADISR